MAVQPIKTRRWTCCVVSRQRQPIQRYAVASRLTLVKPPKKLQAIPSRKTRQPLANSTKFQAQEG